MPKVDKVVQTPNMTSSEVLIRKVGIIIMAKQALNGSLQHITRKQGVVVLSDIGIVRGI